MYIKLSYYVKGLHLKEGETFEYYDKKNKTKTSLTALNEEHKQQLEYSLVVALKEVNVNAKNKTLLQKIAANDYASHNYKVGTNIKYGNGKTIFIPNLDTFPDHFQDFFIQKKRELSENISEFIKVFSWVYNIPARPHMVNKFIWSFNQKDWFLFPNDIGISLSVCKVLKLTKTQEEVIKEKLNQNIAAPEYHNLYSEAVQQKNINPRSSIVIGVSALEVAVKTCIQKLVPDTSWLLENVPSPPVEKLIKNYLPSITENILYKDKKVTISNRLIKNVRDAVSIRNRIVHSGEQKPKPETMNQIMRAIKDILLIIDFYSGNSWAIEYVSDETKAEL